MMIDPAKSLLLGCLALSFYLVGAIWAHEVDIFRSWRLVGAAEFRALQNAHWRKLAYWIFSPLALALAGSVALIWLHPQDSPRWTILANLGLQLLSLALTAVFWGRWQARLSQDSAGPRGIYLAQILRTHWIRTAIISADGLVMLVWTITVFA
ncbi:MAG TPA: hypothetical protein VNF99_04450 [Stellaceae bacterium]|nr:hypothetical protein [Stellaceae bacterium]